MAWVKTFRVHEKYGIPDKDMRVWLTQIEEEAVVSVQTLYTPGMQGSDPRITLIVTKLDDVTGTAGPRAGG